METFKIVSNIHWIVVTAFLFIYAVKTVLLLSNKQTLLAKFSKVFRIPEMIISFAFLGTGIYLMTQLPEIKPLLIIKISLVLLSIPLAVIGFKKNNKILAALSLLLIVASYGLAEASKKNKANVSSAAIGADGALKGDVLYTDNCALCHGGDGKLGMAGAADISKTQLSLEEIKNTILNGKGAMQKVPLSPEQANAVAIYVNSKIKGK